MIRLCGDALTCRSVRAEHSVPTLESNSQPSEEGATDLGEHGQISGAMGWLPAREVNPRGLEIAGEAVHESAGLAGNQVLGLSGIGLFV